MNISSVELWSLCSEAIAGGSGGGDGRGFLYYLYNRQKINFYKSTKFGMNKENNVSRKVVFYLVIAPMQRC